MSKPYKFIICLALIISSLFITSNSKAANKPFIELFEQIFKFLGKRGDNISIPGAGKKFN